MDDEIEAIRRALTNASNFVGAFDIMMSAHTLKIKRSPLRNQIDQALICCDNIFAALNEDPPEG